MDTKIFYKDENAVILKGDMLNDKRIPDNYIDLIVTSPPYNVGKNYGEANDNLEYDDYISINLFSCINDIVLDLFMGNGTTLIEKLLRMINLGEKVYGKTLMDTRRRNYCFQPLL